MKSNCDQVRQVIRSSESVFFLIFHDKWWGWLKYLKINGSVEIQRQMKCVKIWWCLNFWFHLILFKLKILIVEYWTFIWFYFTLNVKNIGRITFEVTLFTAFDINPWILQWIISFFSCVDSQLFFYLVSDSTNKWMVFCIFHNYIVL